MQQKPRVGLLRILLWALRSDIPGDDGISFGAKRGYFLLMGISTKLPGMVYIRPGPQQHAKILWGEPLA